MAPKQKNKAGKLAENFAAHFLTSKGYRIIERNFRSKFGEIDIIALRDGKLFFIEVKARWSMRFGKPEEAVTPAKIWKISRTGEYYSLLHPELPKMLRIEIVSLQIKEGRPVDVRIITLD